MANYLITHYKGTYRIKAQIDESINNFPRKLDGTYEDIDCYIDCYNNIQIFHHNRAILQAYIPSIIRGHNIIKAIKEEFGEDAIFDIEESDKEVLFKFNAKYMSDFEKHLKPKTAGANISPFSTKNLPKSSYVIPNEDLDRYKKLIENVPQNQRITLAHMTKNFLKSLATKKNSWDKIKADMALKGIKGKEYIHSIGKWDEYLKYLEKNL